MQGKKDIETREDLDKLLAHFYGKLLNDERISFLFTDVAKINLSEHLPVLVDFWETALLGGNKYRGNPMGVHFDLHEKSPLTKKHFSIWLGYWIETIEELFEGKVAEEAKSRARSIGLLMQHKLEQNYGPLSSE
jgi:hemoglobin